MIAPPVELLRARLSYEESSGVLTWLPRSPEEFKQKRHYVSWTTRCSGKQAGVYVKKKHKKYLRISIAGYVIYAHRAAWAIHYGFHANGEIDHINGDSSDNRIENLRLVSHEENSRNAMLQRDSKSGYCGVSWHAVTGKWRARVKFDGKEMYLGIFDDPAEAALRVQSVRDSLGFHENHGRPEPIKEDA